MCQLAFLIAIQISVFGRNDDVELRGEFKEAQKFIGKKKQSPKDVIMLLDPTQSEILLTVTMKAKIFRKTNSKKNEIMHRKPISLLQKHSYYIHAISSLLNGMIIVEIGQKS